MTELIPKILRGNQLLNRLKYGLVLTTATLLCLFAVSIIHQPKAHANIWGGPGNFYWLLMPPNLYNYLLTCDGQPNSPAYTQWISAFGAPTTTSVDVAYGQASVPLSFNWNAAICHYSPNSIIQARLLITGATPGVIGMVGQQSALWFGGGNPVGFYTSTSRGFTYAPAGGFTTSGWYPITLYSRTISQFPLSPQFGCVTNGPGIYTTAIDNFAPCPDGGATFYIYINVIGKPPMGNLDQANCSTIAGWAFDPDSPNTSIPVDVYINGPYGGGGTGVGRYPTNIFRGDVNGKFGIGGNHGFSIPTPSAFLDGLAHSVYVYAIGVDAAGNVDNVGNALLGVATIGPCYHSACTINSINSGQPIVANQTFKIQVTLTNNGPTTWPSSGPGAVLIGLRNTAVPGDNWWTTNFNSAPLRSTAGQRIFLPRSITPGASLPIAFTARAPNQVYANKHLDIQPLIEGVTWINDACSINAPIWGQFTLKPFTNPLTATPDEENPSNFSIVSGVDVPSYTPGSPSIPGIQIGRVVYWTRVIGGVDKPQGYLLLPPPTTATIPEAGLTLPALNTGPPPGFMAGDQVCSFTTINHNSGIIRADGVTAQLGPSATSATACARISNKPYLSFYGNDVFAGGGFSGGSCNTTSGITAFTNNTIGSGVQLAALALGQITQFNSAILRTSTPTPLNGLSFANTGPPGYLGVAHCVPDYWSGHPSSVPSSASSLNITPALTTGVYYYKPSGGTLDLKAPPGVQNGQQLVLYVDGNVNITGNVVFNGASSWAAINDIPSLYLIVQGNIYIQPSVAQLDGVYITQPKLGVTPSGTIYTCANGTGLFANAALYDNCKTQLTVNGAFIAQQVKFLRTFQSLRNSNPLGPIAEYTSPNAAEVFYFSPEIYLAKPQLPLVSGSSSGTYDYITSLPPVL